MNIEGQQARDKIKQNMSIVTIPSGFAVMTSAGSVVGFAATLEIAKKLKASAEANAASVAELEKQGVSLGW